MSMIIAKQTAAANSLKQVVAGSYFAPKTFVVCGDLTTESISVLTVDKDGETNILYDANGEAVTLTATSPPLSIYAPLWLIFQKPITANAVGVQLVS